MRGGTVESLFVTPGSVINISGGTVNSLIALDRSVTNISGGVIDEGLDAESGSEVNLFGTEFLIDVVPLEGLLLGVPMVVADRDMGVPGRLALSGTLADGTPFDFTLDGDFRRFQDDFFSPNATLTVTLVPEPAAFSLSLFVLTAARRRC